MSQGQRATRRSILKRGLIAAGGVASVAGLGAAAARGAHLALPAGRSSVLKLAGVNWHASIDGKRSGQQPAPGERVTHHGELRDAAGAKVGEFYSDGVFVGAPLGAGPFAASHFEMHTFNLAGGSIAGMGTTSASGPSTYAIIGGTGRYSGATGSYTGSHSPFETGGDGTAAFLLTINLPEVASGN